MKRLFLSIVLMAYLIGIQAIALSSEDLEAYKKGVSAIHSEDYLTADKYIRPLAERGDAISQFIIGGFYFDGFGVTKNYYTAFKWYRQAAEKGVKLAQYNVGDMYYEGLGVTKDFEVALKWHKLAAEQGVSFSQARLADMYFVGNGVAKDDIRAHMWWSLAGTSGLKLAEKHLKNHEKRMTLSEISKAKQLASHCLAKKFKNC